MNYNAYWYDPEQDQVPWDTNDICIGNRKYICKITEVTSGNTPEEALADGPVAICCWLQMMLKLQCLCKTLIHILILISDLR